MNGRAQVPHALSILVGTVLIVASLRYAQDVFVPLAVAVLLTFLLSPLVARLQRWHFKRPFAVIVSVVLAVALIGGIVYVVLDQFADLARELPRYRHQLRANLLQLTQFLHGGVSETSHAVEQLSREIERVTPAQAAVRSVPKVQIIEAPLSGVAVISDMVSPLLKPLGMVTLVLVFVIFMLLRLPDLRDRVIRLLGARNLRLTTEALDVAGRRVSRYLLIMTLVNCSEGVLIAIGLSLIGIPNAALWGALTAVLRFIPYVGAWTAAAMPTAIAFAVSDSWLQPLLTVSLFAVLELSAYLFVEPWLYANHTGVSPVALLIAAAFWTWLWGPVGLLLAIPLTVCLVVMGTYIPRLAFLKVLLGDEPVLAPHERLYERLLASNRAEAEELLQEALREQSPREVCDTVIAPALQLAESDRTHGAPEDTRRQEVLVQLREIRDQLQSA